ncbi:hypothetical protein CKO28_00755 [Rhodovibrio sodomensis]|uniref:Uncharacterized protein n=1 Tax=Rhodovibrio sodomensis TaxID=1088 RepID=A0ABS1D830_9PROT|nr:hypothetical protein [Rhodovibrio sodomensis]MBK1666571.1 hypothetical protein [Rhodovibrio sodomensis]
MTEQQGLDPEIRIEVAGLSGARPEARRLVGLLVDEGLAAFDNEADYVTGTVDVFDRELGAAWREDTELILQALSAQLLFYHPKKPGYRFATLLRFLSVDDAPDSEVVWSFGHEAAYLLIERPEVREQLSARGDADQSSR